MPHNLQFEISHEYNSTSGGIWIPTHLTLGNLKIDCEAKVDTGAEYCVFQRELGDALGLEIEQGHLLTMNSVNGATRTYGH